MKIFASILYVLNYIASILFTVVLIMFCIGALTMGWQAGKSSYEDLKDKTKRTVEGKR